MNISLFRQMVKLNMKNFLCFGFGSALYVVLMTSLYPLFADNTEAVNELIKIVPETMKNALGFDSLTSYGGFISAEYFGLFFPIILGVFSVMTATQLLAHLVDKGSMAYLLSTKVSRSQIAFTQGFVLISGLLLIVSLTFLGGIAAGEALIDEQYSLEFYTFFQINFVGFLLFFVVGGYSFLVSSLCNDEKTSLGTAGALTFIFYGLDMAGKISPDFEWLRNITPFSLYNPSEIASGDAEIFVPSLILFGMGCFTYAAAVVVFKHRNLPL
ncbi:ABC transporter permease subunit [Domibacillus indicus]|uniref:ABC transporter permease subunit n=1 Tax=Domibacillus indicus TaxID=1437523 RepID=UPI000617FEFF|nr:ABC transporter permease subunit [Domibacillus indicus]